MLFQALPPFLNESSLSGASSLFLPSSTQNKEENKGKEREVLVLREKIKMTFRLDNNLAEKCA